MKRYWLLSLLCTCTIHSQQRIELAYVPETGTITFPGEGPNVKVPMEYILVLTGINSAHIGVVSELHSREFVSAIPELLVPLFPGIRDNSVFGSLETDPGEQERPFIHAIRSFQRLERLKELGDALYRETRFAPDTANAQARHDQLLEELRLGSLDELALNLEQTQFYTQALLQSYSVQIDSLKISDSDSLRHKLVYEYSILRGIQDRMEQHDYPGILDFIRRSLSATDSLYVGEFTAKGDVVDLELELMDTYTGESLYKGTLSFGTHGNFSFDFSTGFFYTNLVDHRYYTIPGNAGFDHVLREDHGEMDLSIGALAHFVYKLSPRFAVGIALGTSLSPMDGNLRYLLGPSFTIGYQKQFSISLGYALARLDRLSDGVPKDPDGHFLPTGEPIRIVKKTDIGFFIGITYNLNRKRP